MVVLYWNEWGIIETGKIYVGRYSSRSCNVREPHERVPVRCYGRLQLLVFTNTRFVFFSQDPATVSFT